MTERRALRNRVAATVGSAAALQVLLVEAESDQRELLKYFLDTSGYLVRTATATAEALAVAREHLPDLIIAELPDGPTELHWLQRLHEGQALRDIPVLILSAWADEAVQTRARLVFASAFVTKPAELADLLEIAQQLMVWTPPSARQLRQLRRQLLALQRIARHLTVTGDVRERMVALMNRLQSAVLLFDESGTVIYATQLASELFKLVTIEAPTHQTMVTPAPEPVSADAFWCGPILLQQHGDRRRIHGVCLSTGAEGLHVAGLL